MILYADWSSMALSLGLVSPDGRILARRQSESDGAASLAPGDYPARLATLADDWLGGAEAVYVSGMATGRGNWRETGYVSAPALPSALLPGAIRLQLAEACPIFLLPGLSIDRPLPDVMRGEELKIWGLAADEFAAIVLPGKHSKWAVLEEGRIQRFATFLSGEIEALLARDSILSRLIPSGATVTESGILAGLKAWGEVRQCGGGVLRAVFSARSNVLAGHLPPADIPGYLQALVLAAEIDEARGEFLSDREGAVALIGAAPLCDAYARILGHMGLESRRFDGLDLGARTVAAIHGLHDLETRVHNVEHIIG